MLTSTGICRCNMIGNEKENKYSMKSIKCKLEIGKYPYVARNAINRFPWILQAW